jgi:MFS family permease
MRLLSVLGPLRHGPFARYMGGEFISMTGTWMQVFAQGWLLTSTLTSSCFMLGVQNFTAGVPMLLLTLVGGRFADRYDKRIILYAVLVVQIACALGIGSLVAHHQIQLWHIYLAAGLVGIAAAFEVPAVAALVPELVPKEEMANAIALDRASFHATRLIGPSVGGAVVEWLGVATAYYANAFSYLALAIALLTVKPRRAEPSSEDADQGQGIAAGIAYVKGDEPTRAMILLMAAMTAFVSPFAMITLPYYANITLGFGPRSMGQLMAFSGLGSLCGALGLIVVKRGRRALILKLASSIVVLSVAGLAAAHTYAVAVVSLVGLMLGLSTSFGTANIVVQERAPDHMRGRVSAVSALSFFGIVPFSGLLLSGLVDMIGMRTTLLCGAGCYAAATYLLLSGRNRLASTAHSPSSTH